MYETTKKTVTFIINGEEKVLETHAKTVKDLFEEQKIKTKPHDFVSPSMDTKIQENLQVVWEQGKQVLMVKDHEEKKVWTTAKTVGEFLKEQNITVNEHDKLQPAVDTKIKNGLKVQVDKAFPLTLKVDGKKEKVWSTSTTVADFLANQGVKLNKLDRVKPSVDSIVKENDVVKVIRVEKVIDVVEEPVEFAVVTRKDHSLANGKEKIIKNGKKGLVKKEYEVVLENGKEVSRKLMKETTVKEKQDKIVAVGTKPTTQTVSRGIGNVSKEFYVTATAFTANCNGCSGRTATGINLRANPNVKIIAVDPSIIPLGTKVYVEGYGYATAADTGSNIKGNRIDVFFPSKSQAYRWGKKTVKIKILK